MQFHDVHICTLNFTKQANKYIMLNNEDSKSPLDIEAVDTALPIQRNENYDKARQTLA